MNTLADRINALSGNNLIEAAQFFTRSIAGGKKPGPAEQEALALLNGNGFEYVEELEELSRIILLTASEMPEYEPQLEKALAGVGQKSVVLGGAEIIILASLALVGLHIVITKGKSEETETSETVSPDGKVIKTSKTTKFNISSRLGDILKSYFSNK